MGLLDRAVFDDEPTASGGGLLSRAVFDDETEPEPFEASPEALAINAERLRTGKRKQFDDESIGDGFAELGRIGKDLVTGAGAVFTPTGQQEMVESGGTGVTDAMLSKMPFVPVESPRQQAPSPNAGPAVLRGIDTVADFVKPVEEVVIGGGVGRLVSAARPLVAGIAGMGAAGSAGQAARIVARDGSIDLTDPATAASVAVSGLGAAVPGAASAKMAFAAAPAVKQWLVNVGLDGSFAAAQAATDLVQQGMNPGDPGFTEAVLEAAALGTAVSGAATGVGLAAGKAAASADHKARIDAAEKTVVDELIAESSPADRLALPAPDTAIPRVSGDQVTPASADVYYAREADAAKAEMDAAEAVLDLPRYNLAKAKYNKLAAGVHPGMVEEVAPIAPLPGEPQVLRAPKMIEDQTEAANLRTALARAEESGDATEAELIRIRLGEIPSPYGHSVTPAGAIVPAGPNARPHPQPLRDERVIPAITDPSDPSLSPRYPAVPQRRDIYSPVATPDFVVDPAGNAAEVGGYSGMLPATRGDLTPPPAGAVNKPKRIVSDEAVATAKSNIAKKRGVSGKMNLGKGTRGSIDFDPTIVKDYAVVGARYIEDNVRDFGEWSAAMVKEFGDDVRAHLDSIYQSVQGIPSKPDPLAFLSDPNAVQPVNHGIPPSEILGGLGAEHMLPVPKMENVTKDIDPTAYPARLISKESADAARKRMYTKIARSNAGFDPTMIADAAIIGAYHIETGVRDFGSWSKKMIAEFGDGIQPHLASIYAASSADAPGGKYAKSLNTERLAPDNPALAQKIHDSVSANNPQGVKPRTIAGVQAASASRSVPALENLRRMGEKEARGLDPVDAQAIRNKYVTLLAKDKISDADHELINELERVANLEASASGQSLSLHRANAIDNLMAAKNYRGAARVAIKEAFKGQSTKAKGAKKERVDKKLQEILKKIDNLPNDPAKQIDLVYRESRKTKSFINTYFVSNLLSNPMTQTVNAASSAVNLITYTLARSPSEYGAAIGGAIKGVPAGAARFKDAFSKGYTKQQASQMKIYEAPGFAAGGGYNPFNWGGRGLMAVDEFLSSMAESSSLAMQGQKEAIKKLGKDKMRTPEFQKFVDDFVTQPRDTKDPAWKEARSYADEIMYRGSSGTTPGGLDATGEISTASAKNKADMALLHLQQFLGVEWFEGTKAHVAPMKLIVPFFNTIVNTAKAGVKYSPAGAVAAPFRANKSQAALQATIGSLAFYMLYEYAKDGNLTVAMPTEPAEMEAFMRAGKKPNSINLFGKQVPVAFLGPFWFSAVAAAATADAEKRKKLGDLDGPMIGEIMADSMKGLFDSSPLVGLNTLMGAVSGGQQSGRFTEKLASNTASGFVPLVGMQTFGNKMVDPAARDTMRDGESFAGNVGRGVVGRTMAGQAFLPERIDSLGQKVVRESLIPDADAGDPVFKKLLDLGLTAPQVGRTIKMPDGSSDRITAEEYRSLLEANDPLYDILQRRVQDPEFLRLSPETQKVIIKKIFDHTAVGKIKDAARKKVVRGRIAAGAIQR